MIKQGGLPGEAQLEYKDSEFDVIVPGRFVVCAVTGQQIELEDLHYWSVDLQEPYINGEVAVKAWRERQRG